MNPERFLNLAKRLAEAGGPEECRTAISRAYYAVFNVAEKFLARMNFHRPKMNYHPVLQKRLLASGDAAICRIGSDLGDFHEERVQADYHMQNKVPESKENAAAAVIKAAEMIEVLNGCPINSKRWKDAQANIARVNVTGTDKLSI